MTTPTPETSGEPSGLPIRTTPLTLSPADLRRVNAERTARGETPWPTLTSVRTERRTKEESLAGGTRYGNYIGNPPDPKRMREVPPGALSWIDGVHQYIQPLGEPVDAEWWTMLVEHPDERVPLLLDGASHTGMSLYTLCELWATRQAGERSAAYPQRAQAVLETLWPRVVDRAERDARASGVLMTPLLEAVISAWEGRYNYGSAKRQETPFAPGRPAPDLAALEAEISTRRDPALALALLDSRSATVREMVVQRSPAFQDPDLLLQLVPGMTQDLRQRLLGNAAIREAALTALRRWGVVQLIRGIDEAKIWEELEREGVLPDDGEMRLLRAAIASGDTSVRRAAGKRPWLGADPEMARLILGDASDIHLVSVVGQTFHGEMWWRAVETLRRSRSQEAPGLLLRLLQGTRPEQLATLSPVVLRTLLTSDDKEVRTQVVRLAGGAGREDRIVPEPVAKRRRR